MSKHDRAKQEKRVRNQVYANRYRQRECKQCKHRSSRPGKCVLCGEQMKERRKENGGTT